jgi:hypothetical protein
VRQRNYLRQRKERAVYETRKRREVELLPAPDVDILLGVGDLDPFDALPVRMSSSDKKVLDYCGRSTLSHHIGCFRGT